MTTNFLDRRQWLTRTGAIAAFGALWSARPAAAQGEATHGEDAELRKADHVIDVACQGHTFRPFFSEGSTPPPDLGGTDSRGGSFFVEGLIYRAGTTRDGTGVDPFGERPIGQWFCRGWFIAHVERPFPHVITTQEYLLGIITPENFSPIDTLVSSGVEGSIELAHRAVVGGSGRYPRARGDVRQLTIGSNTTELVPGALAAPNFSRVGNAARTIIGVMPPEFQFPGQTDVWLPETTRATNRTGHNFFAVGRLKPDVSLEQGQADLAAVAAHLEQQ